MTPRIKPPSFDRVLSAEESRRLTEQHRKKEAAERRKAEKERRQASTQKRRKADKNKMRPTLTIALRDRITEIVETRTPDAKEMSFEEKVWYLKRIMTNFKKNFWSHHPNRKQYCEANNLDPSEYNEHEFNKHITGGGLFKEFQALDAFLAEVNEGEA